MARSPFPTGDFGRRTSQAPAGIDIGAPAAGVAREVAGAARDFSRTLRGMAEKAWTREGIADAADAIAASAQTGIDPSIRQGRGVDDEAYNTVVREQLLAQRQQAYAEMLDRAQTENPDSLGAFGQALAACRQAFLDRRTGDAEIDAAFARWMTTADGAATRSVRQGEERRRVETMRGAFTTAATTAQTLLGQAIASAGFDDQGAELVGQSLTGFAERLSKFGPREAFTIGGVEFAADPSRAAAVSPEELGRLFEAGQANARMSWIAAAGERSPDAASKRAFVGQVRERWAAGDAAFAGLDAQDMDRLTSRLESDAAASEAGENAARSASAERAKQLLKAGEYGANVDPSEIMAEARASGDPALVAQAEFAQLHGYGVTPDSLRADASEASNIIDFVLDDLEGSGLVGNDNGRGRAQYGITELSHPEAFLDGVVDRAEATTIYRREYLVPLGRLSTEMEIVAFPAAVVAGVPVAKELLAQAQGDPERFLALEMQRFERLARENPAKYGDDLRGWRTRSGRVRGRLQQYRAQVRARDGFANDPIGYARGTPRRPPLAPVTEFDLDGVFNGGEAAWSAALRARRATGRELERVYKVPPRILSDDEEAFYRARFQSDPASILTFTTAAAQALGEDGARELLGQMGRNPGQAAADLHMASLAMDAGARGFSALAAEGRRLLASGAAEAKFEAGEGLVEEQARIASAVRTLPDLAGPVLATAKAAAAADAARGELKTADHYVQSALGRNPYNGHHYGGVASVNGAATLLPTWVRQDAMDEVLGWVAGAAVAGDWGPVYGNGQAIPAHRLSRMRLQAQPEGQYRVIDPASGRPVNGRDGRPFEFDIDTDERHRALRRAFPDLIRPRR